MPRPSAVCDFVIQQVNSECSSAMSKQNGQLACFPFHNHTQRMSTQPLSVRTGECTAAAGSVAQRSSFWLLAAIDGHAKNFSVFLLLGGYHLTPLYDVISAWPLIDTGRHAQRFVAQGAAS